MIAEFLSASTDETKRFGAEVAVHLRAGDCIVLVGNLGSGKTTFVQGIANGLGIAETVRSPTFVLMREYRGRVPLYHFDAYRINNLDEFREIGFEDILRAPGVIVIEWGERAKGLLPAHCWRIEIELLPDTRRKITLFKSGCCASTL